MTDGNAIRELRRLAARQLDEPGRSGEEHCDLCGATIPSDHRHMLQVDERRIICSCETCRALYAGEGPYRPTGTRTLWLEGFDLPDELWASLQIPIGLAFFFESGAAERVLAFYPSPAGTTECELDLSAWDELVARNPMLGDLEPDAEALIVNRLGGARQYAIVPIDECYRLVGLVRTTWEGISGGTRIDGAVRKFFEEMRERAA